MLKSSKGITLVALVITIILLLILAGVTLKIVLDDDFVGKTQQAVDKYNEASTNETEQIQNLFQKMTNILERYDNTTPPNA